MQLKVISDLKKQETKSLEVNYLIDIWSNFCPKQVLTEFSRFFKESYM